MNLQAAAENLHKDVPPGWYYFSIKENFLQRYWHKRRFEEIAKLTEPANLVLDVGCADGMFTNEICKKAKAKKVIAIDVLKHEIAWAKKHWQNNKKITFKVADAHKLPFKTASFDAAFSLEMLEHVFEPVTVLKEIRRVMKKGAYAVFLVPSDSNLFKLVWFFWTLYRGRIWKDTHIQTYRKDYLVTVCKNSGFKVVKSKKFILGMLHAVKVIKK